MSQPQLLLQGTAPPASDNAVPLLEVNGLTKDFPGQRALDGVDLVVRAGEIHALLGENGAGKSTLIKIVVGALTPDAGSISVSGREMRFHSPQEALAQGISVVHQHSNLVATLSVQENLFLGERLPRRAGWLVDWKVVRERAARILARVGLVLDPEALVQSLRPDEVAMLSIAKAIASNATLIILDEPTTAMLPKEVAILFSHMRRLAGEGHGFIYVSHRIGEVLQIADRVTVLRDGRVAANFARSMLNRRAVVGAIIGKEQSLIEEAVLPARVGEVVLAARGLAGDRVESLSFELRAGEILGLAGLPGSGAEETFDLAYGRKPLLRGYLQLNGSEVKFRSPRDAVLAGLALVPKERLAEAMLRGFSVRENISLPSLAKFLTDPVLRLIRRGAENRSALAVVQRLNVKTPGIESKIDALSGGNQQKAVLGRWLASGARVYLLNSPTAAVDVGAKVEIYALVRALADAGAAVLFTSTEVEEFARLCHRVLVFQAGKVVGELSGAAASETAIMELAVGGEDGR